MLTRARVSASTAMPKSVEVSPRAAPKYILVDYLFQFITITAGVLIALLINGLVEWNRNRALVVDARTTIAREIASNKNDLEATLGSISTDLQKLESALTFANDLLTKKSTSIKELNFHINLADLSASGWRTAERTGALSHMAYDEVQRLSLLYDLQDLIVEQQRALLNQLSEVSAILSGDFNPSNPNRRDLELFRERLMRLRAALLIHKDLATRLAENYAKALQR
jgi:hypothetical protein